MDIVIVSFGHGMVPKIFWVCKSGQGYRLEGTGIGLERQESLRALLILAGGMKISNNLNPNGCMVQ